MEQFFGKGFTEWNMVKNGKSQHPNSIQPKVPLGNHHYDLSKTESLQWQINLAKTHGIHGFIFYHYWFGGSDTALTAPINNMLELDVDFNFCMCLANESWINRWTHDKSQIDGTIKKMDYSNKNDWDTHFFHLLKIFKNKNYIKINNKPVLVVYRIGNIDTNILKRWKELSKKNGFNGVHVIAMTGHYPDMNITNKPIEDVTDARCTFSPLREMSINKKKQMINTKNGHRIHIHNFDDVWLNCINPASKNLHRSGFVSWDNTARRMNKLHTIDMIDHVNFGDMGDYLTYQYYLTCMEKQNHDNRFIFFNAWNEWGEGTYLEPDTHNNFKALNTVSNSLTNFNFHDVREFNRLAHRLHTKMLTKHHPSLNTFLKNNTIVTNHIKNITRNINHTIPRVIPVVNTNNEVLRMMKRDKTKIATVKKPVKNRKIMNV
jgi:hypothetical protein